MIQFIEKVYKKDGGSMKKILKELYLKNEEFIIKQLINFIIVFIAAFMAISWAMDLRGLSRAPSPRYMREMRPHPMPVPRPPMPPEPSMQEHSRPIPPANMGIQTPSAVPPQNY